MYTLKTIARRSTALGMAVAVVAAAVMPAASVFADALNPLTERSLLLTSSAPGYVDTDGSGNSAASPNSIGENYAPAGSGPNGKKTGETFTFTVSSTAMTYGFSLQYCTAAAGLCQAPGNNPGDARSGATTPRSANTDVDAHAAGKSDFDFVGTWTEGAAAGNYQVRRSTDDGTTWTPLTGWTMTAANLEDELHSGPLTGKDNYITFTNSTGQQLNSGDIVEIRFRPSEATYITNPGADEFFVKINTYSSATELYGSHNEDGVNNEGEEDHTVIDGGVTVANVMTDSIHITTKVLETMSFSVGTQNRDTVDIGAGQTHIKCDPILTPNNNRLNLGNPDAEYSLETGRAWDVYSYWRLSSNSSGGASVYYSGDTLRNTVGDHIADMPNEVVSTPGGEQFGLGFVNPGFTEDVVLGGGETYEDHYPWLDTKDTGAGTWASGYSNPNSYPFRTLKSQEGVAPFDGGAGNLQPQIAANDYDEAEGTIWGGADPLNPVSGTAGTAKFKFLASSLTVPELIAQQNETVISCATAKMRYVANIGADTPAGVYTTKINYLAAPQY